MNWNINDAEKRLTEVVDLAQHDGPQQLTQAGDVIAVVLSKTEYERLTHQPVALQDVKPGKDFIEHLRSFPKLTEDELKLFERKKDFSRDVDFGEDSP